MPEPFVFEPETPKHGGVSRNPQATPTLRHLYNRRARKGRLIKAVAGGISSLQQTMVDIPGSATFRGVAGDVYERTFHVTSGAQVRRIGRGDEQTAFSAFPVI
jgi:hypothetical protein